MHNSYCGVDRRYVQIFVSHVAQAQVRISEADLAILGSDSDSRIPWDHVVDVVHRIDNDLSKRDPAWAVRLGSIAVPEARGLLGSLLLNAPNIGVALATAVELDVLLQSAYATRWIEGPEVTELRFERNGQLSGETSRPCEIRFAALLTACSRVTDRPCKPIRVHLTCDPFEITQLHRDIFGDNIVFNAEHNAMFIDKMTLARPIPGACASLFKQLRHQLWSQFGRSADALEIEARVSRDVGNALDRGQGASIEAVARRLGTSTRSLQRALGEAGLTYRSIVDRARHERATQLLKDRSHSLLSIALSLGFSDQASFTRACLRWSGQTPKHYRDTLVPPASRLD